MFQEAEEQQQRYLQSLIVSLKKADAEKRKKEQEVNLQKSLLKTVNKLNFFVFRSFHTDKFFVCNMLGL